MGIDISIEIGYGVGGEFDSYKDLPGKLKTLVEQDEEFLWYEDRWKDALGLPDGVSLTIGGDYMSGPQRWALVVDETHSRYGSNSIYDLPILAGQTPVSLEGAQALSEAMFSLDIDGTPGWMFMGNIS